MNFREGTRRLALLLGVAGAILCCLFSLTQLQSLIRQRAEQKRFEKLANSQVVQQDRYDLLADCVKQTTPKLDLSAGLSSHLHKDGIDTITWSNGCQISSITTEDGETVYPTPAPGAWSYVLIAVLPLLGFFIPWAVVRAIGWVGAGFVASPK
jgi:predicted membrane chloride channel (bestrophin family)